MPPLRARLAPPRRFAWLLWLALVLPLAQGAGAVHVLSHLGGEAAGEPDGPGLHAAVACDLCVAAANVAAGAPPATAPVLCADAAPPPAVSPAPARAAGTPPPAPYRSRAPPVA